MDTKIAALIDSYTEAYAASLTKWIQVPSVCSEAAEGAPFGKEVRRMLDVAIADADAMGFATRVFDGYAGDITLGDGAEEPIAVLAHLDVVPAGDGWKVPPFAAVREGSRIIGRGTSDDKGPALCALYAMKAIKEAGVQLKKPIRLILGCDEESGWADMDWYCKQVKMPDIGFSPDAAFPVINTEKGMIHMMLNAPLSKEGLQVKKLWTGERVNVIPGESEALLAGGEELKVKVDAYAAATGLPYTAEVTADGVVVKALGIPGHSAYPWGCRNANGMMLLLLKELGVQGALLQLADMYPMEHDGTQLGIACSDEVSGPLTCNMGILHVEENGTVTCSLDCRCPISADLEALKASIFAHLPGFTASDVSSKPPHHVPAESELVTCLLSAYAEETGLEPKAMATGGGTYAKVLKQGVAFGSAFPDDEDLAHQANEYVDVNKMIMATKVYANALLKLCAE